MTLLTEMMERPLDAGYAAAANRRTAEGLPAATSLRSWRVLVGAIVIGLLIGGGASVLRTSATAKSGARDGLVRQIEAARKVVDTRSGTARELRAQVAALDARLLGSAGSAESQGLGVAAGAVGVKGPGFVVTLDDAASAGKGPADSDPRTGSAANETVQAVDLQAVVNGLWEAGAEAIAINGQRLSSTASIRFAGEAILVDFRPLTRPYVIEAIGDPGRMPAAFADGTAGSYVTTLHNAYGISVTMEVRKEVVLPAAATLTVRVARPVPAMDTGGATSSPSPERAS